MATLNINNTDNQVTAVNANQSIIVTDNGSTTQTSITVTQPVTSVVLVNALGPVGPQGPSGSGGGTINTSSFATTGSNTFIGNQTISGSLAISGSVTADNLWYRYTLTNLPLNTAGTYTIVPVTPGYKFVPMKVADPNDIYNTT
jgi:hypothetical protein